MTTVPPNRHRQSLAAVVTPGAMDDQATRRGKASRLTPRGLSVQRSYPEVDPEIEDATIPVFGEQ